MKKKIAKIKSDFEAWVTDMREYLDEMDKATGFYGTPHALDDEPAPTPPDPEPGGPGNGAN